MAWAIFHRDFRHDRRPKQAICFEVKAGPQPQSHPHDVIDAAVAAGAAKKVRRTKTAFHPVPTPERTET